MKKSFIILLILIAIILIVVNTENKYTIKPVVNEDNLDFINLPEGFKIETFYDSLGYSKFSLPGPNNGVRMMLFHEDTVFAAVMKNGYIIALEDKNRDNKIENSKIFISNLKNPHNIEYYQGYYYIAEQDKVIRVKDENNDNVADLETKEKIVDLPSSGGHFTRTLKIIKDKLFISIGSSCNVCSEEDERRASIQVCELNGDKCKTYASGLRNSVDFTYHNDKVYATENSRDNLGNDIPHDEINIIEENNNYGWPYCYSNNIIDSQFATPIQEKELKEGKVVEYCLPNFETPSFIDLQAHSAPLGLAFYQGNKFPEEYQGKLFVAYHGSWNRNIPTGYKVVMIDVNSKEVKDFATGWLDENYNVKGRPVGITNFRDSLLVSDDNTGKIYRIYYE